MSRVLTLTVPSNPLTCELALISLVKLFKGRSSIPNIESALIVILPPCPCSALARISLSPLG
jgi:hypothetical protein